MVINYNNNYVFLFIYILFTRLTNKLTYSKLLFIILSCENVFIIQS